MKIWRPKIDSSNGGYVYTRINIQYDLNTTHEIYGVAKNGT